MTTRDPPDDVARIAEEAAEWLEALEDADEATRAAFSRWLRASPRHIDEFLLMRAIDVEAASVDPTHHIDVQELLSGVRHNIVDITGKSRIGNTRLPGPDSLSEIDRKLLMTADWNSPAAIERSVLAARRLPPRFGVRLRVASAVGAVAVAMSWWMLAGPGSWTSYTTKIGEQRTIELPDGSLVQLNTRSKLTVKLSREERDVRLLEGEAMFRVSHDPARPFRVLSGDLLVQAVGTQFNVDLRNDVATVSVIEGRVGVARINGVTIGAPILQLALTTLSEGSIPTLRLALLSAGEEAHVTHAGGFTHGVSDIAATTAWRQRRLIFHDNSLAQIADEFNRYNRNTRILIRGAELRARRYGGTFDADDPESLVQFLKPEEGILIGRDGQDIVISEGTQK
jgi:transmembrane sensor